MKKQIATTELRHPGWEAPSSMEFCDRCTRVRWSPVAARKSSHARRASYLTLHASVKRNIVNTTVYKNECNFRDPGCSIRQTRKSCPDISIRRIWFCRPFIQVQMRFAASHAIGPHVSTKTKRQKDKLSAQIPSRSARLRRARQDECHRCHREGMIEYRVTGHWASLQRVANATTLPFD